MMKISLVGFTGVGKTAIGLALADHLRIPFYDLDRSLETKTQQSISELIGKYGVEHFRNMESEALNEILGQSTDCVISTGGGTLVRPANRSRLKKFTQPIWLKAKPETIWQRIQDKPYVAPLFFTRQDPLMAIRIEMSRREPHYEDTAAISIDVDGKNPDQIIREIKKSLNAAPSKSLSE